MSQRSRKRHPSGSKSTSPAGKGSGQLRVIAGEWRGRKLPVADLPGLRPTSDRVRETVFNWLSMYVPGAHVLDCFSGSGALALEALSRGAESAILLEKASVAAQTLKSNLNTLKCGTGKVINTDSLNWLQQKAPQTFDLVFLDPPFRMGLLEETSTLLEENGYLNENSLIYVEVEKELSPIPVPENWQLLKNKTAGQTCFMLWSRSNTK